MCEVELAALCGRNGIEPLALDGGRSPTEQVDAVDAVELWCWALGDGKGASEEALPWR